MTQTPAVMRDAMTLFAQDLADQFGWDWKATSQCRPDHTAHGRCAALDIAFRSGPLFRAKQAHDVNYYRDDNFVGRLLEVTASLSSAHPMIRRVLIELDHLHIDYGLRRVPYIKVGVFAPGKCHRFGCERPVADRPVMLR